MILQPQPDIFALHAVIKEADSFARGRISIPAEQLSVGPRPRSFPAAYTASGKVAGPELRMYPVNIRTIVCYIHSSILIHGYQQIPGIESSIESNTVP